MIYGTGVDIVKIQRIEKLLCDERFLDKMFSENEKAHFLNCASNKRKCEMVAGSFAAKEAYAKAVGTGFSGFSPREVEILHNDAGAPYIIPAPAHKNGRVFHLAISHEKDYAVAFVICEGE